MNCKLITLHLSYQIQISNRQQIAMAIKIVNVLIVTTLIHMQVGSALSHFQFDFESWMIPHPDKAHRGGEDAFFNSSLMLAVADGVGGWNSQGIDPSKYSRFLCQAAQKYTKQNQSKYTSSPLQVLIRAQEQNQNIGSATMVVVTLDGSSIKYCYLGDSGFMVLRKYEKMLSIFQFVQQQHGFNFPFQLAMPKYGGDDPRLSICGSIQAKEGDIVVVGSDGFFDNFAFHEVLAYVQVAESQGKMSELPQFFAHTAIERGKNTSFDSPFAQRARRNKLSYEGGKLDDTTVIVAEVRRRKEKINQL